ncbi:MAG: hypothetical protein JW888_10745 [Pirellulales bacterium]|nr:hypothetical protein [Pirellulales bacterium]
MKAGLSFTLGLLVVTSFCRPLAGNTDEDRPEELTTIKYCAKPMRTFDIVGNEVKGLTLAELPAALKKHHEANPRAAYEVYAEVKSDKETSDKIIATIQKAGVTLKHYWAPVSFPDTKHPPGKYGPGYVDLLRKEHRG